MQLSYLKIQTRLLLKRNDVPAVLCFLLMNQQLFSHCTNSFVLKTKLLTEATISLNLWPWK